MRMLWWLMQAKTGSGLPGSGLGAVEGFSYLSLLAGIAAFGSEFVSKGGLPGPLG